MSSQLKYPLENYAVRLTQFYTLIDDVKALDSTGFHLWAVMDSVAFQDTETALLTELHNAQQKYSANK